MRGQAKAVRGLAVVAVALSPFAAVDANAAVQTGGAEASGPGIALENTGGNIEIGEGRSESRVVIREPGANAGPAAPPSALARTAPAKPVAPSANANARAKAIVDAARARAQAQVDAARRQAEEAVQRARQQAEEARARSDAQSQEARARAAESHGSSSSASASYED